MQCWINCMEHDIPTRGDGTTDADAIKKEGGIPPDRLVIRQDPDGSNHIINPEDEIPVQPGDRFTDSPIHVRGG